MNLLTITNVCAVGYNRQLWAEPDQTDKDGYDNALVRSHNGGELTLSRTVTTETVSVG